MTQEVHDVMINIGWEPQDDGWRHPAYGLFPDLFSAVWIEFTDLRERVLAMEANAKMPPVIHGIRGKQRMATTHAVGVEVVRGNKT